MSNLGLKWKLVMPTLVSLGLIGAAMDVGYRNVNPFREFDQWMDDPASSLAPVRKVHELTVTRWVPAKQAPKIPWQPPRSVTVWSQSQGNELPNLEWADERVANVPEFLKAQAKLNFVPAADLVVYLEEPFEVDRLPSGFTGTVDARREDELRRVVFIDGKEVRIETVGGVKTTNRIPNRPRTVAAFR